MVRQSGVTNPQGGRETEVDRKHCHNDRAQPEDLRGQNGVPEHFPVTALLLANWFASW